MAAGLASILAFPQWQFKLDTTFRTHPGSQGMYIVTLSFDGVEVDEVKLNFTR